MRSQLRAMAWARSKAQALELAPYLVKQAATPAFAKFLATIELTPQRTIDFLVGLNQRLQREIAAGEQLRMVVLVRLVAALLTTQGYRAAGTTFIGEHGTVRLGRENRYAGDASTYAAARASAPSLSACSE